MLLIFFFFFGGGVAQGYIFISCFNIFILGGLVAKAAVFPSAQQQRGEVFSVALYIKVTPPTPRRQICANVLVTVTRQYALSVTTANYAVIRKGYFQ